MGIRAFIAALTGAAIGMCQFLYIAFLDAAHGGFLPKGDVAYFIFSLTWLAEMFALIVIAMYRISPWVARLLRDEWEAVYILKDKSRHLSLLERLSSGAIFLRAAIRGAESGHVTSAVIVGAAFGLVPFVIPRPKRKKEPNQSPEPMPLTRHGSS